MWDDYEDGRMLKDLVAGYAAGQPTAPGSTGRRSGLTGRGLHSLRSRHSGPAAGYEHAAAHAGGAR